ncbi:MAG: SCO family protein [Bordetella sp.]|uniref:SCO family protein n=1 Tax=Bordetella sp. TaxID=28081 RepID=UPI003F7B49B1
MKDPISCGRRRALRVVASSSLALAMPWALTACGNGGPAFKGSDITGTHLGKDWTLTDFNGQPRTLSSFAGKVVVVFFGYTQCPDVCPTSMAELADVMHKLGPDADKVQVLFITVDPDRDTAEILKQYATAFDARFLALRGTADETRKAAAAFKAYYAKVPGKSGAADDYTMDHTAAFYLFDTRGEARVLAKHDASADDLAHDIKLLLKR